MQKLAIITSHPIQYYAPWFRYLVSTENLEIKVFYLWNFGVTQQVDQGFKQVVQWDIPLLEGYDYTFVPNTSSNPGTHHFWGLQNPTLLSQVQSYHPDAVLLMNYNYASFYRFIVTNRQFPLLFRGDSHRLLPQIGFKAWAKRQWIRQVYQQFAACLYVGKANYDYFRYHGVPKEQLFFSPHAVDNERFFAQTANAIEQAALWKQELGIPKHHAVVLFTGKFEPKKRPQDLLHAFLAAHLSDVSLLFVGTGSLEPMLKAEANPHANIFFAPFQNQSFMPRTYAIADLVVLPSYDAYETWGLAINEAMCLSKPVIVSSLVGCAYDLVHPGINGMRFTAGNIAELTQCLREAFSDRTRLQYWGKAGRELISSYSYSQATQGLQQALATIQDFI
jgi:glycosyltransferase involved in cell wall biosynthesis